MILTTTLAKGSGAKKKTEFYYYKKQILYSKLELIDNNCLKKVGIVENVEKKKNKIRLFTQLNIFYILFFYIMNIYIFNNPRFYNSIIFSFSLSRFLFLLSLYIIFFFVFIIIGNNTLLINLLFKVLFLLPLLSIHINSQFKII